MKKPSIQRVDVRGRRYRLRWHVPASHQNGNKPDEVTVGLCDPNGNPDKKISINWKDIDNEFSEKMLLEVLLHEFLHASLEDLKEEVIDEIARDGAKFLYKVGWRLNQ